MPEVLFVSWPPPETSMSCTKMQPIFLNRAQWAAFERAGVDMADFALQQPVPVDRGQSPFRLKPT